MSDDVSEAVEILGDLGMDVSGMVDEGSGEEQYDAQPEPQEPAGDAEAEEAYRQQAQADFEARQRWQSRQQRRSQPPQGPPTDQAVLRELSQLRQRLEAVAPTQQRQDPEFPDIDPSVRAYFERQFQTAIEQNNQQLQAMVGPILERFRAEDQQRVALAQRQQEDQARQAHVNSVLAEVREYSEGTPEFKDRWSAYDQVFTAGLQRAGLPPQAIEAIKFQNAMGMATIARDWGLNPGYLTDLFCQEMLRVAAGQQYAAQQNTQQARVRRNQRALAQPGGGRRGAAASPVDAAMDGRRDFSMADARKISRLAGGRSKSIDLFHQLAQQVDRDG